MGGLVVVFDLLRAEIALEKRGGFRLADMAKYENLSPAAHFSPPAASGNASFILRATGPTRKRARQKKIICLKRESLNIKQGESL